MIVGNAYTKFYTVSTLTIVEATLSVDKIKMMVGNVYSMFYSVDTYITVAVATLSVNMLHSIV